MKKSFDDVCDVAYENATRDRERLEKYVDVVGQASVQDPEIAAALADSIIAISEALTKNNAQFVELAKVQLKYVQITKVEKFAEEEIDDVYESIDDDEDTDSETN